MKFCFFANLRYIIMIIRMKKAFPWQILLNWYEKNGKHDFPWRDYTKNDKL